MPPSGITGATFIDGRLYVAGQGGGPFRVWSIDLADGSRRLEIERKIVGESEGLVTARIKGGTLSWLIQPFDPGGGKPTYRKDRATLLSFRSVGGRDGDAAAGDGAGLSPAIRFLRRSRATVLKRRGFAARVLCPEGCTARLEVRRGRQVLARTIKRAATGRAALARVELTRTGRRVLRTRPEREQLTLRATLTPPSGTAVRRTAKRRLR